jgi:hypothetical protein
VTDDAILPHYLTLVVGIYFYFSYFDELSSEDESSGDNMYPIHLSDDGNRSANGEQEAWLWM